MNNKLFNLKKLRDLRKFYSLSIQRFTSLPKTLKKTHYYHLKTSEEDAVDIDP